MREFKDRKGRTWSIEINLGTVRRVQEKLGVNLLDVGFETDNGEPLTRRLLYDDLFFANVCAVIMDDQGALFDEFGGCELKELDERFWAEYKNFFADRGRDWAAKALEMDRKTRDDKAIETLEKLSGATSSSSPVEPESAPGSTD